MKKSNTFKKLVVFLMAFVFTFTLFTPALVQAAKKPSLNATEKTIVIGKTFDFNVANALKDSKYAWSSNNEKVAKVDKNGIVTGVGKGTAKIQCRITGAKKYLLSAEVSVLKPAVVVKITSDVKNLQVGDFCKLKTSLTPASSNDKISWSSSDTEIADIEKDGSFVAEKEGSVTLTATSVSGRTDSITIQVGKVAVVVKEETEAPEQTDVTESKEEVKVLKKVLNEDFSANAGSFKGRGAAIVVQTTAGLAAEGGKGYIKVSGRTANWNGAVADVTGLVTPGATYQVTGWIRYTSGNDVEVFKITQERTSKEEAKYPTISGNAEVEKGKWVKVSGIMEVSPSTTQCLVYFEADSLIDFFVDNVVIEQLDKELVKEQVVVVEKAKVGDVVFKRDFEDGSVLDPRGNSERTNVTTQAHNGKASLEVKRTAGWDGAGVKFTSDNKINIDSLYGMTVHASFYVMYKDGPDEVNFKLNNRMEKKDNSDSINAMPIVKKGEWTLIEADCLIADGALRDLIFIETDNNDALTFYIDDVELKVVK